MKRQAWFIPSLLFLVVCSCATNPGRTILPPSKGMAIGLDFSINTEKIPGIEINFRKKINDAFEVGSQLGFISDVGGIGFKISPYVVAIAKASSQSYWTVSGNMNLLIHQEPSEGHPFRFLFFPGLGSNYINFTKEDDEFSAGLRYDQYLSVIKKRNPYEMSLEYLGININYLSGWDESYFYNGIDYFFPNFLQYELGWGGWM